MIRAVLRALFPRANDNEWVPGLGFVALPGAVMSPRRAQQSGAALHKTSRPFTHGSGLAGPAIEPAIKTGGDEE